LRLKVHLPEPFRLNMNTLMRLAALALVLLPACGGAIESPEYSGDDADDGIVTVVTRYYPPAAASTPAPSDAPSPATRHDEPSSPMEGDDVAPAPTPAPSPATRDDEVAPAPAVEQPAAEPESPAAAPDAPAPSPEYSNDEPEAEAAPELLRAGDLCTADEQCANGQCERLEYPSGTGPLVFTCSLREYD
jgi:hypothetical protein